jgi:hypothetical protein
MTEAVHDQHWRLAIPRDHDRIDLGEANKEG